MGELRLFFILRSKIERNDHCCDGEELVRLDASVERQHGQHNDNNQRDDGFHLQQRCESIQKLLHRKNLLHAQ